MDVTVQVNGDHELSLAEFLDGCAKVANETTSVVRSTLEDLNADITEEKNKTNLNNAAAADRSKQHQQQNEVPEKHGKNCIRTLHKDDDTSKLIFSP